MIGLRLPRTKRDWVAVIAGAAFAIGSGVALFRGCMSLTWPKTDGTITYSKAKNTRRTYTIDIRYRYSAGGQPHDGDRYRFHFVMMPDRMRSRDVDLVQARYPVGERVMVAVNPSDVSDAVLLPGPDFAGTVWLGFGMLLMFGGLVKFGPRNEVAVVAISPGRVSPRYRTAKVLAVIGAAFFLYGASDLYEGWDSLPVAIRERTNSILPRGDEWLVCDIALVRVLCHGQAIRGRKLPDGRERYAVSRCCRGGGEALSRWARNQSLLQPFATRGSLAGAGGVVWQFRTAGYRGCGVGRGATC